MKTICENCRIRFDCVYKEKMNNPPYNIAYGCSLYEPLERQNKKSLTDLMEMDGYNYDDWESTGFDDRD